MSPPQKRIRPLILHIPVSTHLLAMEVAKEQEVSLNHFIKQALLEAIERIEIAGKEKALKKLTALQCKASPSSSASRIRKSPSMRKASNSQ